MKNANPKKLLQLNPETLRQITGGFPGTFGPATATLRTATVAGCDTTRPPNTQNDCIA